MSEVDWAAVVFDSESGLFERLKQRARRRFVDPELAEEAFDYALAKLSDDGWSQLSSYSGQAKPTTFLFTVYNNLLEDFRRHVFGRRRPPRWLERLGELFVRVFELLCVKRLEPETVVDWLCARGQHEAERVREAIRTVKGKIPSCGQTVAEITVAEVPDPPEDDHTGREPPDVVMRQEALAETLLAFAWLLDDASLEDEPGDAHRARARALAERFHAAWPAFRETLALTAEERLMLRLVYEEGYKFAAVGRAMDQPEHRIRRRLQDVHRRIVAAFSASGLSPEALAELRDG